MNNFDFGEVLTKAWQIIWKHKILWIFGILAGCGQGSGGSGGRGGGGGNTGFSSPGPDLSPQVMQWLNTIEQNLTTVIAVSIGIICGIWILVIFLSTIGRIGLIRGTYQADSGTERLIFGQLFSESMPYFWRMFWLGLIVALPFLILIGGLVIGFLSFAVSARGGNDAGMFGVIGMVPILIGCMCVLVPVMFVVGMIIRQSQNAVVLEDMEVMPALSRGWEVFRANLGPVLVMGIILAIIGFVIGIIITIPVFLVVIPTVVTFIVGQGESFAPFIFMGVCLCIYIPIAMVLQGILISYTESAWTLTYMRLTQSSQQDQDNETPLIEADA